MQRRFLIAAALAAITAATPVVHAQSGADAWPTRPVRILVGFPGGSTPDIAVRIVAEPLAKALGQPVVVENRAGASGNIAADQVAKARDDHTLGAVINGNLTSAKMLNPKLSFDPAKDFSHLSLLATAPLVLVAPADKPAGAAFFAAAKAGGDRWSYGSVGVGSVGHLGMELLKTRVDGLAPVHIPFKGNPEVITSLIQGDIQLSLVPPGVAMPQVRAGKLRAVGVTTGHSALVPDVPSLADAGVRDFVLEVWTALVGPANLSQAAKDRLAETLPRIVQSAEVRQKLFDQGWMAVGSTPAGMKARVEQEAESMRRIISAQGIRLE
ncbi:MAG: tripartite tricarboxylate transporter substrate binding protein [Hydrogenophaga sp.]|uniref:Bug family tripartite tricarboxylate transporter substrate binding protein n=1 Tax=Hydrogenophaga sp. TaxID=1904254 RepID=UPI0016A98551|nr:tripartite tricarboxylate transporter substrate binding protein [Hydrogenophaga sp.]NIM43797.1 tripartite tricarboxylate transporter substrate binding protein [Hydrogenophaga sp.]NIN28863.1 tripartite tricarboxylate transporter substrate binding protein [Hydrogenophaga sp.]NIN33322.1 tripartite tricarboxylate transporter substrate binding protein [Hydrogenophaga sp.]NIN57997.1 tripartite tricarboxylate transporter substrate binding protein [Hydrogenophaga sp.]NIO54295.1 tripartite tricarbox